MKDTSILDFRRSNDGYFFKNAIYLNPNLSFAHVANLVKDDDVVSIIVNEEDAAHFVTRLARVGVQ